MTSIPIRPRSLQSANRGLRCEELAERGLTGDSDPDITESEYERGHQAVPAIVACSAAGDNGRNRLMSSFILGFRYIGIRVSCQAPLRQFFATQASICALQ